MAAARRLFPTQGYHATGIRQITAAARVNLGGVTYHYGSKRKLYHELLREVTGPLVEGFTAAAAGPGTPLDRIEAIVRHFFAHVRGRPEMIPLMVREMAGTGDLAAPVRDVLRTAAPLIGGVIAAGQAAGQIRPGNPLLLTLSTMAQPVYLNLSRKGVRAGAGQDVMDEAHFEQTVEHAVAMVRAMLQAPGKAKS